MYNNSVLISHLVWVLLGVLLVLALLGLAHNSQTINIGNLASDPALVSITGKTIFFPHPQQTKFFIFLHS